MTATLTDTTTAKDTTTASATPAAHEPSNGAKVAAAIIAASKDGKTVHREDVKAQLKTTTVSVPGADKSKVEHTPESSKTDASGAVLDKSKTGPKAGEKAAREGRENAALARISLKRDGYTDEEIDALPESARITVGLKAKAKQDEAAKAYAAGKEPNQSDKGAKLAEAEGQGRTREPQGFTIPSQPGPDASVSPSEELEAVLSELDEDHATFIRNALKASDRELSRKAEELEARATEAKQETFKVRLNATKAALKSDFPKIVEKDDFKEVLAFMDRLRGPDEDVLDLTEAQISEYMSAAAAAVFGKQVIEATRAERANQLSQDISGTPRPGGPKGGDSSKGELSKGQLAAKIISDGRASGLTDDEIRKQVRASVG